MIYNKKLSSIKFIKFLARMMMMRVYFIIAIEKDEQKLDLLQEVVFEGIYSNNISQMMI
jgi:hypothetical protein